MPIYRPKEAKYCFHIQRGSQSGGQEFTEDSWALVRFRLAEKAPPGCQTFPKLRAPPSKIGEGFPPQVPDVKSFWKSCESRDFLHINSECIRQDSERAYQTVGEQKQNV